MGQCQGRVLIRFLMRRMLALTPKIFQNVGLWKVPSAVLAAASTTLLDGSKENKASLCSALKAVRAGQRGKKPSLLASRQLLVGRSRGLRALPKTSRGPLVSPFSSHSTPHFLVSVKWRMAGEEEHGHSWKQGRLLRTGRAKHWP